jgi:hypothetical protein
MCSLLPQSESHTPLPSPPHDTQANSMLGTSWSAWRTPTTCMTGGTLGVRGTASAVTCGSLSARTTAACWGDACSKWVRVCEPTRGWVDGKGSHVGSVIGSLSFLTPTPPACCFPCVCHNQCVCQHSDTLCVACKIMVSFQAQFCKDLGESVAYTGLFSNFARGHPHSQLEMPAPAFDCDCSSQITTAFGQ